MVSIPTIVVAGYGGWAKAKVNPAEQVLRQLTLKRWTKCRVEFLEIPVDSLQLSTTVEQTLLDLKPDAWIGLGVASGANIIKAEMVGVNWLHFRVPDIKGYTPKLQRVMGDGACAYDATLPNQEIVQVLNKSSIPANLSFSAGTHMCNQMLYSTRYFVEKHQLPTLCGFMHIPQSAENISQTLPWEVPLPSMPLSTMTNATELAIEVICQHFSN